MIKPLVSNFFKDRLNLTIIFALNSFLITLFFYLSVGNKVEILYPAAISLFIYIIFMCIEWYKYYRFNSNLRNCIENMNYNLGPVTNEQKEINSVLNGIHERYLRRIHDIQLENHNRKHFISQWIHNMKTPVSVIDLIIQKISSEDNDIGDSVRDIKEENEKLLNNLEHVLSIIRLDDFSKDYVPEAIDIVALVKKVINSKKNQFIYNNVFPKLQTPLDSIFVLSDSKWNEILIEQVVSNAIKYSSDVEKTKNVYFIIEITQEKVSLTIKDEGLGIPDYDVKKVFEPFFTGENGRKYRNATGIGLYICSVIASKLGHQISLKSEVRVGTEVKIIYLKG